MRVYTPVNLRQCRLVQFSDIHLQSRGIHFIFSQLQSRLCWVSACWRKASDLLTHVVYTIGGQQNRFDLAVEPMPKGPQHTFFIKPDYCLRFLEVGYKKEIRQNIPVHNLTTSTQFCFFYWIFVSMCSYTCLEARINVILSGLSHISIKLAVTVKENAPQLYL